MKHRNAFAEGLLEAPGDLRRERDLGHQDDRASAGSQNVLDRLNVNKGLAASGDPVQQHFRMFALLESRG